MFAKLLTDEAGRYEAKTPSALEKEQGLDYDDNEDLGHEEEVPLLLTKTVRPASWLPFLFCICINMTGLALNLSHDLRSLQNEAFSIFSNASAATQEHVHTFETLGGGSISLYKVQWQDQPWDTEDTYICHLQGLCIEQHEDMEGGGTKREYWLMGEPQEETSSIVGLDNVASDAFKTCLGHADSNNNARSVGIKHVRNHKGDVSWIDGSTLAMPKITPSIAHSGDSLARLQAWSRFMSLSVNAPPDLLRNLHLSTKRYFKHLFILTTGMTPYFVFPVQLPTLVWCNLVFPPCASYRYATKEWTGRHFPDQGILNQEALGIGEAVCFSHITIVAPSKQFFRNREDANYFRSWAYHRAGIPQERNIPTHLKDLKAVILLRPDQPMWGYKRVTEIINETGIHDIRVTTITPATTSATHIDLWSNADIVISDDHDALTGQVLMRPGTAVLEVFPPLTYEESHKLLAVKTGVHYIAATTADLVLADIVHAEDPSALPKFDHARDLVQNYPNQAACQSNIECQQVMYDLGAYVDEPHFRAGLRELLRRMAPPDERFEK